MCLQETKIKEIKVGIVRSLGMGRCLEWGAANLRGTAGGVMVFWDISAPIGRNGSGQVLHIV